uniref:Uncharacterized protein n=1 Tax=Arundo donax TaxID=35708 RepID=A0A0A8ZB71_ARUDO
MFTIKNPTRKKHGLDTLGGR